MAWSIKKLEDLAEFQNGLWTGKKGTFVSAEILRNTNFKNNDGTLNFDDIAKIKVEKKQLEPRTLSKGDILLERSGGGPSQPVGRVVYFEGEDDRFGFSNFTTRIRTKVDDLSSKYLWFFLYSFYVSGKTENMQKKTTGIRNLTFSEYKQIEIPLPSLSEQKKIVAKLEKLLGKVKEAKRLRAESQEAANNLLSAELHKIFEEGKKKGWDDKRIDDICQHPQYGFTASSTREKVGPKILRITDIQNGRVDWSSVPYCECSNMDKYQLKKGDLVFARTGATVGKSYLVADTPSNTIYASYLIRLRATPLVLPEFLYLFFQSSSYWKQITDEQIGMAQPNVNGSKLAHLKLLLPSIVEQKSIVSRLNLISEKANQLKECQEKTEKEFIDLEKSILRKAFSGKF